MHKSPKGAATPDCARLAALRRAARHARWLLGGAALVGAAAASAQTFSYSGFGTLGWAQSNRDFVYLRNIDQRGTPNTDSVFGLQGDLQLNPRWSATVQLRAAQSADGANHWSINPAWAFVAWRPSDHWLLRAGRFRLPIFLYSEQQEIGQSYDSVRLPPEVYSVSPTADIDGVYVTRTWAVGDQGDSEFSADFYNGATRPNVRFWLRDGIPGSVPAGPLWTRVKVKSQGLVLTYRQPELTLRLGYHRPSLNPGGSMARVARLYPWVPVAPGVGYYQVSDQLPGPGIGLSPKIRHQLMTLAAEWNFAPQWRLAAEYAHVRQYDTEMNSGSRSYQFTLSHHLGKWTPYVGVARMMSNHDALDWYARLVGTTLPPAVPGAALINAAQRVAGEVFWAADQTTWSLGTAYALTPSVKLKGEWARTHIGVVSRLANPRPAGDAADHTSVDVWSFNMNFAF